MQRPTKELLTLRNPYWRRLRTCHRRWLQQFDRVYLANWEKLFNADRQAALWESAVREWLQCSGVTVEPNEHAFGHVRRTDFLCDAKGYRFLVEATCIKIEKVVQETGLPYPFERGARHYRPLNDAFWAACKRKAHQCGNADYPVLLAVGTFHSQASAICVAKKHVEMLLTGETQVTWHLNVRTGRQVGQTYLTTKLRSAAFIRPNSDGSIGFARSSISGLLVCGLGILPAKVLLVLHPNPVRPFDASVLPNLPYCNVRIDRKNGLFKTQWRG